MPAGDLAARWRAEIAKLPEPIMADSDSTDTGELVRVLKRPGVQRIGCGSVINSTSLSLAQGSLSFFQDLRDGRAAARLRGSEQGRGVIRIVQKVVATQKFRPERDPTYWSSLEDHLFRDKYWELAGSGPGEWARVLGLTFDKYHGAHVMVARPGLVPIFDRIIEFVSYLTGVDPAFPGWEFPAAASSDDMLHPRFRAKVARYYEVWLKM